MEEKYFTKALSSLNVGLVRLDAQLRLSDKNIMADLLFPFPKRGAKAAAYFGENAERVNALKIGMVCSVTVKNGHISSTAAALRERDGGLLLILHPLFSIWHQGGSGSKLLCACALAVYGIVKEMQADKSLSVFKTPKISESPSSLSFVKGESTSLTDAIKRAVTKLSQRVLDKNLALSVDSSYSEKPVYVMYSLLEYAVSQMIDLREMHGENEEASLAIKADKSYLILTLEDSIKPDGIARYHIRVSAEILRTADLGCYVYVSEQGQLTFRVYIPYESKKPTLTHC